MNHQPVASGSGSGSGSASNSSAVETPQNSTYYSFAGGTGQDTRPRPYYRTLDSFSTHPAPQTPEAQGTSPQVTKNKAPARRSAASTSSSRSRARNPPSATPIPSSSATSPLAGPGTSESSFDASTVPWTGTWSSAYPSSNISSYQQGYSYSQPYQPYQQTQFTPTRGVFTVEQAKHVPKPRTPSPSPPPPKSCTHWDKAVVTFLQQMGLTQALRGFELDMLAMNTEWEKLHLPDALQQLIKNVEVHGISIFVVTSKRLATENR